MTFNEALEWIKTINADMGGTEILAPIKALRTIESEYPQTIVLLTDGSVSNEN